MLAALIGSVGGFLGAWFQKSTIAVQEVLMGEGGVASAGDLHPVWRVALPALGGLVAGLLLLSIQNRRRPFGISDIVALVALRKGAITIRDSIVQVGSSLCTIATGGSIGKEGANSQIAAMVATVLGRWSRADSRTRAVLLGCAAATGMACSYNAPIAGAIFVMEAVLGNFAMDVFAPVVAASVAATLVSQRVLERYDPLYVVDLPSITSEPDLSIVLPALLLGVFCGIGGILFRHAMRFGGVFFRRMPLPLIAKMTLGGLIVGIIALWIPQVWGNGFTAIGEMTNTNEEEIINGVPTMVETTPPLFGVVLAIVIWKVVATAITSGSGALGGIFTPNLVVGAAFGVFFAYSIERYFPGVLPAEGRSAFALVGMAGLCAALTHAPITAVVLLFELTGSYQLILPLMLCSITASVVARLIDQDSWYSASMRARGEELPTGLEETAVQTTFVHEVMRGDLVTVTKSDTFDTVMDRLGNTRRDRIFVLDAQAQLVGHIHLHDVKLFINDPSLGSVVIAEDMMQSTRTVSPEQSIGQIMPVFDDPGLEESGGW